MKMGDCSSFFCGCQRLTLILMQTWFLFHCDCPRRVSKYKINNFSNAKLCEMFPWFWKVRDGAIRTWRVRLASISKAGTDAASNRDCDIPLPQSIAGGKEAEEEKVLKGKYWLKERRHKGECGRTVNEPENMEKNSSATVIRLDFRSNCSVPAPAVP